jgi:hypothetical protein
MPGQDKVPSEPVAAWGKGREAHAHLQRDPRLLRQHLHRAKRGDHGQHLVEGRPDVGVSASEMPVQITELSAGVDLVPVGEAAPASRTVPHRRRWHGSIIADRGGTGSQQAARFCRAWHVDVYSPSTRRSPRSTSPMSAAGRRPASVSRSVLLTVTRAVTLTTESLGRPEEVAGRKTLPGIAARPVLEVITAASVVFSRLALNGSAWMIRTGRRLAGRLPRGSPGPAQQTLPRRITSPLRSPVGHGQRGRRRPRSRRRLPRAVRRRPAGSASATRARRGSGGRPGRRILSG